MQRRDIDRSELPHWQVTRLFSAECAEDHGRRNAVAALRVRSLVDRDTLVETVAKIQDADPALRAALSWNSADSAAWLVTPASEAEETSTIPVEYADLRDVPASLREGSADDIVGRFRQEQFDVSRPPLVRVLGIRLHEELGLVMVVGHPALFDRRGIARLVRRIAGSPAVDHPATAPITADQTMAATGDKASEWAQKFSEYAPIPAAFWATAPNTDSRRSVTRARFLLDADAVHRLRDLAERCDTDLTQVLVAVHARAVGAATGRRDVVVGVEHTFGQPTTTPVGCSDDILPVRIDCHSDGGWEALVQNSVAAFLSSASFSDVSQLSLTQRLGLDSLAETTVAFSVEDADLEVPFTGKVLVEFTLNVEAHGLEVELHAGPDCTDDQLAELARLHEAALMLCAAGADPNQMQTLSDDQFSIVMHDWNGPPRDYPLDRTVHDLIEQQTARTPDAVAVEDGVTELTFAQLDRNANRMANLLRSNGAGPGTTVAIMCRRDSALISTFLGVLKAGAAYLPIEPTQPSDRITYLLEDSGCLAVLTDDTYEAIVPTGAWKVLRAEAADDQPDIRPEIERSANSLMYVIYTSGSTGNPKGVEVPHSGVVNYLGWCQEAYAGRVTGGAALFSSVGFDMVVPNIYTPLVMGQRVHVINEKLDMETIAAKLSSRAPYSFLKVTPGQLAVLSEMLTPSQAQGLAPTMVVGADAFPVRVLEAWRRTGSAAVLLNEYGPTEASVGNCVYDIGGAETGDLVPIGQPIPNTTMYVLDADLRPVPVGVPGELYIGGSCVVRGYVGRADLTAARFLPDPFSPAERPVMYRTGDIGRWLPEGNLSFLGRIDEQVKIRGYRVEPAEVEAAITAHSRVREAVVTAAGASRQALALVGYYVSDEQLQPAELRAFLSTRIPDYLLPQILIPIPQVPLSKNGKVDRKALPAPDAGRAVRRRQAAAAAGPAGQLLGRAWRHAFENPLPPAADPLELRPGAQLALGLALTSASSIRPAALFPLVLKAETVGDLADRILAELGERTVTSSLNR